jgi:hypothetical protein
MVKQMYRTLLAWAIFPILYIGFACSIFFLEKSGEISFLHAVILLIISPIVLSPIYFLGKGDIERRLKSLAQKNRSILVAWEGVTDYHSKNKYYVLTLKDGDRVFERRTPIENYDRDLTLTWFRVVRKCEDLPLI